MYVSMENISTTPSQRRRSSLGVPPLASKEIVSELGPRRGVVLTVAVRVMRLREYRIPQGHLG